jgi:ribosomal protein S19
MGSRGVSAQAAAKQHANQLVAPRNNQGAQPAAARKSAGIKGSDVLWGENHGKAAICRVSANTTIVPSMFNSLRELQIHNGRKYIPLDLHINMWGFKLGEFIQTRKYTKKFAKKANLKKASKKKSSSMHSQANQANDASALSFFLGGR